MKKLHPLLKKEIHLPEMDELKVLAIVVAMIAVSVFTVDKYVGLSNYRGEAASMYEPLKTRALPRARTDRTKIEKTPSARATNRMTNIRKDETVSDETLQPSAPKTNCKSRAAQRRNPECKTNAGKEIKTRVAPTRIR